MSITLIGSSVSPFVRKVNVVLLEKGLDFEHDPVTPFAPPENFRELSPLGKIPALRHNDRILNDSSIICRYLDRVEPKPALYPADPYETARAEWFEEFGDGGLVPAIGGEIFFPLVVGPMMQGAEPDEARAQAAIDEKLPPLFDYLDGEIGDREFLVGNALSIGDIGIACPLLNLQLAGVIPDKSRWPALHAYAKRILSRSSFSSIAAPIVETLGKRWVDYP